MRAPHDLAADTAVTPRPGEPGVYDAHLTDAWDFLAPSGGVLLTVALRAIAAELEGDDLRPTSATASFAERLYAGPLRVEVTVLRRGNVAAQARAAVRDPEGTSAGFEVLATFTRDREGPDARFATFPADVRPPEESIDFLGDRRDRAPGFFFNFDSRIGLGHRFWERDWASPGARFARWHRYLVPQRLPDGRLDPLAIPPIADTMPPAVLMGLGPDAGPLLAPSLDLTVHFLADTDREWLCTSCTSRRARAGFATADVEVWDDRGELLAYGTQMMILRRGSLHR